MSARPARPVWSRSVVATVAAAALLGALVTSARADDAPTPSADQVAAAQGAAQDATSRASAIDAQLAAARAAVEDARDEAADTDMASAGAQRQLEQATQQAQDATAAATTARQQSDAADYTVSLLAAETYQSGSGLAQLDALLSASGPQDAIDRAAGLEAVTTERLNAAASAESTRHLADQLATAAAEAEQRRTQAAAAAAEAAAEAKADADALAVSVQNLQAQSAELTAQLATLRQTSAALEQARQDGLAREEQTRRDEEARQAGIRAAAEAAAQAAAQQAQALAQQQAQAAADEAAATSARQAAAAQAAAAAAAAQAAATPKPAPKPTTTPSTPTTPTPPPSSNGKPPLNLAMEDMWDRIAWCESGQRWHLNLGSGYYGGLQFNMDAWRIAAGFDFAPRPDLASREEQITAANRLYAKLGLKPWTCRTAA